MKNNFFLPGTNEQVKKLLSHLNVSGMNILIVGEGSEGAAIALKESGAESVIIIVEDNDALLTSRLIISGEQKIQVRMMDFENTDFLKPKFDLVFAQASISNKKRNKIVNEIKRILKPECYFCVGEMIKLSIEEPAFIKDVWESAGIVPFYVKDAEKYYREKKFRVYNEFDLSYTLKEFYRTGEKLLQDNLDSLSSNERSYYKKVLKKISHESNVYLNLGGDNYMGYRMFILRKGKE